MAEPLKNQFDRALVDGYAAEFKAQHKSFDVAGFTDAVTPALDPLELKDRVNLIADQFRAYLPADYPEALEIVVAVAQARDGDSGLIGEFTAWPLCSFVERHGLEHPAESLAAMEQLTQSFSCEFAIRPFLTQHLKLTLKSCQRWTKSKIPEVRRLPSEGTRPYLPWGTKVPALTDDPEIGIALLTKLRHDSDEVVRRSVANHLNDIARANPDRVVELAAQWSAEAKTDPAMIRHALRGLVKKGNPGALEVLGFTTTAEVKITNFEVAPTKISLGESIELEATMTSTADSGQRLVIDFVVHHINANGETSPKVFKWTTIDLAAGDTTTITKKRKIATASTRSYHAGIHRIELQIAGTAQAETSFELLNSSD